MNTIKNWWYGWDGPAYKLYILKRWINVQLANRGWLTGNCAGCGKTTKEFDTYFQWHICNVCSSDDVAYNLSEHVLYPNGRSSEVY